MKQKDLAKEYAHKAFLKRNRINPMSIHDLCFSVADIESAFNAGSESVIENASKLEWEEIGLYGDCGICFDVCKADKPLANFSIRKWSTSKDIELLNNDFTVRGGFKSIEEAKSYAIKVYEERIKQVLGL